MSSKARAIKERAHLGSPGRGLETFSGVTPREAPEHLRHGEELRDRGSNLYLLSFALARTADLSIGWALPDTLPAPSDECSLVAGIRTYSPVSDARRARGPRRSDSSSAELFGYINWCRLWESKKKI
ncbi:ankyrin repeat-containing protein [Dorcoceras hygrometricum]|uniref:Ankyrin repeat-containing protein n=1 Tax=Dorcoceras hygrometricum TaxID=472368 RepID=A0A2Z7B7J3_9LAMI|nr:ankyrin repeat-containing protein [Dorcoceras hygrometricum]